MYEYGCKGTFDGVGADIDDNGSLLDPLALDKLGTADGDNKDICSLDNLGQVGGLGMAQSDSAVVLGQQAEDRCTLGKLKM